MARVVFLDVDGVIVTRSSIAAAKEMIRPDHLPWFRYYLQVDQACVQRLKTFLAESKADVVLSSTWRTLPIVDTVFTKLGIRLHDKTPLYGDIPNSEPKRYSFTRGEEIEQWIMKNQFGGDFIIIDDNTDVAPYRHKLVQTDMINGFSAVAHTEATRLFER